MLPQAGLGPQATACSTVQRIGIAQRLLHAGTDRVLVVLGLDDGQGHVGLVVEDVVGAPGLATAMQLAAHDDAALGEADFLAHLFVMVPAGLEDGRGNELGADVPFGERFLVHEPGSLTTPG
ncbi:hypothetical protein D3C85_1426390 [compost metagenome]